MTIDSRMIDTDQQFETAFAAFAATARAFPDNAFLCIPAKPDRDYCSEGAEFTYQQAFDKVVALRRLYADSGVGHGRRVALLLGNRPEHFFHLFALNALGASIVPLNPDNTPDEMLYAVSHSEADLALSAGPRYADLLAVGAAAGPAAPGLQRGEFARQPCRARPPVPRRRALPRL